MNRLKILLCLLLFCGVVVFAMPVADENSERYQFSSPVSMNISLETGWARNGITPLNIHLPELNVILTFWMDSAGQVFAEDRPLANEDDNRALGRELCRFDKVSGQLLSGSHTISAKVYENGNLRTRCRCEIQNAELQLDIQKNQAVLNLNGIVIPARLQIGQETGTMQEVQIGEPGPQGRGRLMLDAAQGRLYYQDSRPGADRLKEPGRCVAEKVK